MSDAPENAVQKLRAWYEIRDRLLGENQKQQDVRKAVELAAVCEHPDAVWLTSLFAGRGVRTPEAAAEVFVGSNDRRAVCFAAVLSQEDDINAQIRRSAEMGYAFAQSREAQVWRDVNDALAFSWSEKSAAQGERDGFYTLGWVLEGTELESDAVRSAEMFKKASDLGHCFAHFKYGQTLPNTDRFRYILMGMAARKEIGYYPFFDEIKEELSSGRERRDGAVIVFAIGSALKGNVNFEEGTIFGQTYDFDALVLLVRRAVAFYEEELVACRKAVNAWSIVAKRCSVVKDIRIMIGKMLWEARWECKYNVEK